MCKIDSRTDLVFFEKKKEDNVKLHAKRTLCAHHAGWTIGAFDGSDHDYHVDNAINEFLNPKE